MTIQTTPHKKRLDALRGYAALIVVIHHCLLVFAYSGENFLPPSIFEFPWRDAAFAKILNRFLLLFFGSGPAFVILFFVLSGYLITSSLQKRKVSNILDYIFYLARRACRIYPTHIAAIGVILGILVFKDFAIPYNKIYSPWFNFWTHPFYLPEILDNISLFNFLRVDMNNVTWSLYYEVFGSLFLPVFFLINKRLDITLQSLLLVTLIYCGRSEIYETSTLFCRYLYCFYLGSFIFFNFDFLAKKLSILLSKKSLFLTIFLLIPAVRFFINHDLLFWINIIESALAGFLIINCIVVKNSKIFLDNKFFNHLGKISYSLYLIQIPIIYLSFSSLEKIFSPVFLQSYILPIQILTTLLNLALSIIAAYILHITIEAPFMKIGKKFSR